MARLLWQQGHSIEACHTRSCMDVRGPGASGQVSGALTSGRERACGLSLQARALGQQSSRPLALDAADLTGFSGGRVLAQGAQGKVVLCT